MKQYWVALIVAILVLLAGAGWLYVRNGDSFVGVSPFRSDTTSAAASGPASRTSGATGVSFAGSDSAAELPCAIRRKDAQKVLSYLATKGEKTRADLAAICKYYGATVTVATS